MWKHDDLNYNCFSFNMVRFYDFYFIFSLCITIKGKKFEFYFVRYGMICFESMVKCRLVVA